VPTTSIARGGADKNFSVSKLDLSKFIPGVTLEFGSVGSQIAGYVNTRKNACWFNDGDYQRLSSKSAAVSLICRLVTQHGQIAFGHAVIRN